MQVKQFQSLPDRAFNCAVATVIRKRSGNFQTKLRVLAASVVTWNVSLLSVSYMSILKSFRMWGREVSMTRSAHAVLSKIVRNETYPVARLARAVCTCYSRANTAALKVFWVVSACFAVHMHKPMRNEQRQYLCYRVHESNAVMRAISLAFSLSSWRKLPDPLYLTDKIGLFLPS
jgi:hypothetical protein